MAPKPILISGAGLASLLLARALRHAGIPFHIFERDADISFRGQGYRLRLSGEGLDAIESVLTSPGARPDAWQRFWDRCGKTGGAGFASIDALTGETTESQGASVENLGSREGKIIGIARGDMRKVFMEGLEDAVQWGRHVTGYELTEDDEDGGGGGGVRAVFADGTRSVVGALLVGGEGVRSEVARQLSGGRLRVYDTGARGIHGQAPTAAFRGLGEGVFRLYDDSRPGGRVFVITNVRSGDMDDPDVRFGWTLGGQPGVVRAPGDDYAIVGRPAADMARALTARWHPRLRPLFDAMDDAEAAFWKITCSTPSGVPEWPSEPRVTVIGDAAHSMTPAGGIGANTAVRDSALLGRLIVEAGGYADGVTAAYEREMRVYASEAVASSYAMARSTFGIEINEFTPTI